MTILFEFYKNFKITSFSLRKWKKQTNKTRAAAAAFMYQCPSLGTFYMCVWVCCVLYGPRLCVAKSLYFESSVKVKFYGIDLIFEIKIKHDVNFFILYNKLSSLSTGYLDRAFKVKRFAIFDFSQQKGKALRA